MAETGYNQRELDLALAQIDAAFKSVFARTRYRSSYSNGEPDMAAALTAAHCIQRWGGTISTYRQLAKDIRDLSVKTGHAAVELAASTLTSLREELASGGLANVGLRIRAAANDDLLAHAEELHQAGYREAAVVVAGCALEIQVRRLAMANGIEAGKFDSTVTELQNTGVLDRNEAKLLRGVYGLRNAAAHGNPLPEARGTVANMISSVRSFLSHHKA